MSTHTRLQHGFSRSFVAASLILAAAGVTQARADSTGVGMVSTTTLSAMTGAEVYRNICQGCHMPDGKGAIGAGTYPPLAGNPTLVSKDYVMITVLQGRRNMPAYGGSGDIGLYFKLPKLNDEQIAAVINYVRSNFGNGFEGTVTEADVKAQRLAPTHTSAVLGDGLGTLRQ